MKTIFLHVFNDGHTHRKVDALIDTGATNNFMTPALAKELLLTPTTLSKPRIIRNVDGTQNKGGRITSFVDLEVKTGHDDSSWFSMPGTQQRFYLADLGDDEMILGYPWVSSLTTPLDWANDQQNPTIFAMSHDLDRKSVV